jgi:hypothetical protein
MKNLFVTISAVMASAVCSAQTTMLISEAEVAESQAAAPAMFSPKAVPEKDAPRMEIVTPMVSARLKSPIQVQAGFVTTPPATIRTESFKVLYGAFQIDITQRLLAVAKITPLGINVQEAKLPSGHHKLQLLLEDSMGRQGRQTIEFEVD